MARDEQLARLRVACISGRLPPDLGVWLLEQLEEPAKRRHARAHELRRAAAATGKESRKQRASELAQIVKTFEELPGLVIAGWFEDGTPERIIQTLMRQGPVPRSKRQLLRIIASG
jgi:hypothetical protein